MPGPLQSLRLSRRAFVHGAASLTGAAVLGGAIRPAQAAAMLWYSASGAPQTQTWASFYKKKTGRTVDFFRVGSVKLAQRIEQEITARQLKPSVIDLGIPGLLTEWAEKGWLMKYDSPEARHYPAELRMDGYWNPINVLTVAFAYNADHVRPEEAPKTWEDLLDPKWKGKMVASDAQSSGATLQAFNALQKTFGPSYMQRLAKQDMLIKIGSGATLQTLVSGERPVAALIIDFYIAQAIGKGANLAVVQPQIGVPATVQAIAIPTQAPLPEEGKRFVDFALSKDAQELWQDKLGTSPVRDDVKPMPVVRGRKPITQIKLLKSSVADLEDTYRNERKLVEQWVHLFK
jgi:iron(III) transport system substrate-binding protein